MTDKTRDHDNQGAMPDQLDRILDAALAKYAAIEPRAGLEERVLANLQSERTQEFRGTVWRWWPWAAVTLAAGIIVVILAWRPGRPFHPSIANRPSVTTPAILPKPEEPETRFADGGSGDSPHALAHPVSRIQRPHRPDPAVARAAPRLDVFPTPRPLSDQEAILANYVARFHDQAVLIARVTNEELERDRLEVFGSSENPTQVADEPNTNR